MKEIEISREKIKKIFKTYLTEKEGRQVNVSVDVNYRSHEPVINYFDETGTPKHLTQEEIRTILQEQMPQNEIIDFTTNYVDEGKSYIQSIMITAEQRRQEGKEHKVLNVHKIKRMFNTYFSEKENQPIKVNVISKYCYDGLVNTYRRTLVITYYKKEIICGIKVPSEEIISPEEIFDILKSFYKEYDISNYQILFDDEAHNYVSGISFDIKEKEKKLTQRKEE